MFDRNESGFSIQLSIMSMDLDKAKLQITKKTKALMYVSLNGRSDDMKEVVDFCEDNNLLLIEDSAQSLGSFSNGNHLGTFGEFGSFSLSTPKIISTGQGGIITTNNEELYENIKKIKNFGRVKAGIDKHDIEGYNFKFSDFLAVIGIEQLKKLPERMKYKKNLFSKYYELIKDRSEIQMIDTNLTDVTPWFVDIFSNKKEEIKNKLLANKIRTRDIYPPLTSQKFIDIDKSEYDNSYNVSRKGLWLPSGFDLTDEDIEYIVSKL